MSLISKKVIKDANVFIELQIVIKDSRPDLLDGLFYTTHENAFDTALKVIERPEIQLGSDDLVKMHTAINDLIMICGSKRKSIGNLAELDVTLREILDDIDRFDDIEVIEEVPFEEQYLIDIEVLSEEKK